MTVPVLLVTGFLGAGKTSAINTLLHGDHGQRVAAIVNDFGAINIDAEILDGAAESIVGLKNGCICCSLQGDLLRTLRLVLDHDPKPERIVIEASGAADPRGIIEMVMDPVLWGTVGMDCVVCVIDAQDLIDTPARAEDALWLAQLRHSDFALLTKTEGLDQDALARLRAKLAVERKPVFDLALEGMPVDLLLGQSDFAAKRQPPGPERVRADRFVTVEWQADGPLSLPAFQAALAQIAPGLLRAKGYLTLHERPNEVHLFQMVGRRATFSPVKPLPEDRRCRMVLIGERQGFDAEAACAALDAAAQA